MSFVGVTRDSGYADRMRTYRILVDDREVGDLADGESETFDVEPGSHAMKITIDWCSSNTVTFALAADQQLLLECGSSLRGPKVLLTIFYLLFAREEYVWLRLARA
jgi:hypothetical protein